MQKKIIILLLFLLVVFISVQSREKLIEITAKVEPVKIKQGKSGILKLQINPKANIKIASHPELRIKLSEDDDIHYSKLFFNSTELEFKTKKIEDTVYLTVEDKEIPISFKLKDNALVGYHRIQGKIIFTAVFQDKWSLKTYQKFTASFFLSENPKAKAQ
jgi:hypothetical protein